MFYGYAMLGETPELFKETEEWARACLKIHSRHLYPPLSAIFAPNSGYIARYAPFIWHKSPTKWRIHLSESNFKTRSKAELEKIERTEKAREQVIESIQHLIDDKREKLICSRE